MKSCAIKYTDKGFTLMEVLVVLVLISLISGLLMDGFGYVVRLRFNVTQQLKKQRIRQLQEHWHRNLVNGIIVNNRDEPVMFEGTESKLQGQSIGTLTAPTGVPQPFTLTLSSQENTIALKYKITEKEEWLLGQWTAQKASFSYLDNEGNWISTWPPKMGAVSQQLPEAIQLQIDSLQNPITWIVSIPGRKNPKPGIEDFL